MTRFPAPDGTVLAYRRTGPGRPLVCLPGGPMQDADYLNDLGTVAGLPPLLLLDLRGTGRSERPADPDTYRVDRQVDDVEALRRHLGLDRLDLLGHSAGASLALLYAARHPDRVGRLVLVCPSGAAVDLEITDADRRAVAELRRDEPWYPPAHAAFTRIWAGTATAADWSAITPFTQGRWDGEREARLAGEASRQNPDAAARYYADGALDPAATRAALATVAAPVLLVAGQHDVSLPPDCAARFAGLFRQARLVVQPGAGHHPWLDDPAAFGRLLAG